MAVDKALVASMKTEATRLRKEADALDKAVEVLTGEGTTTTVEVPKAEPKAGRGKGKTAAKKDKPVAAKKASTGERKARVTLGQAMVLVHAHIHANPGATISDIEASEPSLNRAGITKAIKALEHEDAVKEAGKDGRSVKYESIKEPEVAEEVEEAPAAEEETTETEEEESEEIDPTLNGDVEIEEEAPTPSIDFG